MPLRYLLRVLLKDPHKDLPARVQVLLVLMDLPKHRLLNFLLCQGLRFQLPVRPL